MSIESRTRRIEYGDFQTPIELARAVCQVVLERGVRPHTVIEPTCGIGSFLRAGAEFFSGAKHWLGVEVNPSYAEQAREALQLLKSPQAGRLVEDSFFRIDWELELDSLGGPFLILGNPPWVTSATLGGIESSNVPKKANFQAFSGLDALTGKSNFDISEWMILRLVQALERRPGTIAMLCKTVVARKVLSHMWRHGLQLSSAAIYQIDAQAHFDAAVDACLLVLELNGHTQVSEAEIYTGLHTTHAAPSIGWYEGQLVANVAACYRTQPLESHGAVPAWRSGIKHDCAKVMELKERDGVWFNGLDESVEIEDDYLYPLAKSSDLFKLPQNRSQRRILVTQERVGAETHTIRERAPRTWEYLERHVERFAARKSSIYRDQPRYAIFGVGDYSFAPWKVAISGLYKRLHFATLGPIDNKSVMADDTCYFLPFTTERDAQSVAELLNSPLASEFFSARIFWDSKRPITTELLRKLDVVALAQALKQACPNLPQLAASTRKASRVTGQLQLFEPIIDGK